MDSIASTQFEQQFIAVLGIASGEAVGILTISLGPQPTPINLTDLAHLPMWVGWREEKRGDDITNKVPFDPRTCALVESTNPKTWATRGEAESWAIENRGGVGIVLSQIMVTIAAFVESISTHAAIAAQRKSSRGRNRLSTVSRATRK